MPWAEGPEQKVHFAMHIIYDRTRGGRSLVGKGALCV